MALPKEDQDALKRELAAAKKLVAAKPVSAAKSVAKGPSLEELIAQSQKTAGGYSSAASGRPDLVDIAEGSDNVVPYRSGPKPVMNTPVNTLTDEELAGATQDGLITGPVADEEVRMRKLTAGRNFIQNISDPETMAWAAGRMKKQVGAGILATVDVPATLSRHLRSW